MLQAIGPLAKISAIICSRPLTLPASVEKRYLLASHRSLSGVTGSENETPFLFYILERNGYN